MQRCDRISGFLFSIPQGCPRWESSASGSVLGHIPLQCLHNFIAPASGILSNTKSEIRAIMEIQIGDDSGQNTALRAADLSFKPENPPPSSHDSSIHRCPDGS